MNSGLHRYWWRMLETKMRWWQVWDVVTDSKCCRPILYIEKITNITIKSRQHNDSATNIMILSPTSKISHHHKVTNITMSPISPNSVGLTQKPPIWGPGGFVNFNSECFKRFSAGVLPSTMSGNFYNRSKRCWFYWRALFDINVNSFIFWFFLFSLAPRPSWAC